MLFNDSVMTHCKQQYDKLWISDLHNAFRYASLFLMFMLKLVFLIFEWLQLRYSCRNLLYLSQCSNRFLLFFTVILQCSLFSHLCNIFSTLIPVNDITDFTLTSYRFTSFLIYDVTSSQFEYQHCCNLAMQLVAHEKAHFSLGWV